MNWLLERLGVQRRLPVHTLPTAGIREAGRMVGAACRAAATEEERRDWLADWEADLWRRDEAMEARETACLTREARAKAALWSAWGEFGAGLLFLLAMVLGAMHRLP